MSVPPECVGFCPASNLELPKDVFLTGRGRLNQPTKRLPRERGLNPERVGRRGQCLRARMFRRRPLTLERDQKSNGPGRDKADNFAVRKQLLPVPANNKRRAVHRNCKEEISSPITPNRASNNATARRANVPTVNIS
jgi:hypothetical protein